MFITIVLFCLAVSMCHADLPVTPPIRCGTLPSNINSCMGNPKVVTPNTQCVNGVNECQKMTCMFRKSGWLDGDKVDKAKVTAHFEQYGQEHPEWAPAVQRILAACLASDLPPQGVHVNCPAYDVMFCALTAFIKNTQPSQWSTSAACAYPRQFAAACPVCPGDCFAPQVPYGSCNACLTLPRSP